MGHFLVAGSVCRHVQTQTHMITCYSVTVGRTTDISTSRRGKTAKSEERSGMGGLHQHTSDTWRSRKEREYLIIHSWKKKTTSHIASAKLCQRVGNIAFLRMEAAAWDQSTHLLFVQQQTAVLFGVIFVFSTVLRTSQKGSWQHLNGRCGGKSKNKEGKIGKLGHAAWRLKLNACENDDIRPPTIQLSRSSHIHSIQ